MRLLLRSFRDKDLVPSQVVTRKGGVPGVFVVDKGVARRVPVSVEFDNGVLARIRKASGPGGQVDFTGSDELVASQQGELSDGQPVRSQASEW